MSDIKSLRLAAKEMVEVMGLVDDDKNDIVITKTTTEKELKEIITSAIPAIDPTQDEFTDETQTVIDELTPAEEEEEEEAPKAKGKKKPAPVEEEEEEEEEEAPAPKGKKKPAPVEEEEEEEEENNAPSLYEEVEACKKIAELTAIVKGNTEFKALRKELGNYEKASELKAAMLEILDEEADEQQENAEKGHQKNIASKKVNEIKKKTVEEEEEEEEEEAPAKGKKAPAKKSAGGTTFKHEGSMAQKVDEVVQEGGTWEEMCATLNKEAKKRNHKITMNEKYLRRHIAARTAKNAKFLGKLKVTEDGVE